MSYKDCWDRIPTWQILRVEGNSLVDNREEFLQKLQHGVKPRDWVVLYSSGPYDVLIRINKYLHAYPTAFHVFFYQPFYILS